ncbi:hypothetical protein G6L97_27045 (plasmid) [Agrobacterium tumefaciens]|uniref:hypothetical protein n=1 Tax=Agrobacterium tumefaciens TaxID=358 RepID=UPI0015729191|nr:hypothetical protein [Agrobacterium tumefaciens]WCA73023.1 hypothetical protein G6L97_27045 [Agrobacterium tumefaciens]
MLLSQMPKHVETFGPYRRTDGQVFEVVGTLWESPAEYDYWLGSYEANHKSWGALRMTLIIPKRIAPSIQSALALVAAGPLDQVKSELSNATATGKDFVLCPSTDGWSLIG